jgi:hypothetical protein
LIPQQRRQFAESANLNMRKIDNAPTATGRAVEHPGRNLQPPIQRRTRAAATEYFYASLLDDLVYVNLAS